MGSRSWLGNWADRRSRKLVLLLATGGVMLAPLGYWSADPFWLLALIRAFHGISIAAFTTAFLALVSDLCPEDHRGEVIGYMSLITPIGFSLGPALGGSSWRILDLQFFS